MEQEAADLAAAGIGGLDEFADLQFLRVYMRAMCTLWFAAIVHAKRAMHASGQARKTQHERTRACPMTIITITYNESNII